MVLKARLLDLATTPASEPASSLPAPELGADVTIYFRRLSLGDRMKLVEVGQNKETPIVERQIQVLSLVLAESDGRRAFPLTTETQADDRIALASLPATLADRLCEEAFRLAHGSTPTKEALIEGKASSETTPK
ncbi:hypothetical protein BH11PLA2_BH11PLA2_32390 [soil metagenome]